MIDQIDKHKWLYLTAIGEPEDNVLRLVIEEARSDENPQTTKIGSLDLGETSGIVSDARCFAYELVFGRYVAYSVRDESFTQVDEEEVHTGRLACVYSKSKFLDYVRSSTFASDEYPGPITHYGFNCLNHIVDVAALGKPTITVIRTPNQVSDATSKPAPGAGSSAHQD
jgi:hypothetical protein